MAIRLTSAQTLVRFLAEQVVERDGVEHRFFGGCFGIFGHGNGPVLGEEVGPLVKRLADPGDAQRRNRRWLAEHPGLECTRPESNQCSGVVSVEVTLRLFALTLSGVVALSFAAATTARVREEPPTPEAVRPCGSRGDGNKPQRLPSPVGARLGPLVIWPSIRSQVQAAGSGGGWAFYVKAPIVLPARSIVTLAVAPEAIHLIGFEASGYAVGAAGGRKWVSSVRFKACRENVRAYPRAYKGTVGKYTGFPFGFGLARRSMCVPLEVWIKGRATPIRRVVPFGRRTCR